jgi:hypothetical protein
MNSGSQRISIGEFVAKRNEPRNAAHRKRNDLET